MNPLEEQQRLLDEADIAEARARAATPSGPSLPHDEFMAQLEAEDLHVHAEGRPQHLTRPPQSPGATP
ncbi:hypothetical protein [Streptomyces regalis]|uniref:hypothetical protein n=1 Tax=Streptomyces regalis TaxID=68262 RepID=UPI000A8479BA|nr:hypothetical protein [Streptomyces regalis]